MGQIPADAFIDYLVELRGKIRQQKLYQLSDEIRDRLIKLGIVIEDLKEGDDRPRLSLDEDRRRSRGRDRGRGEFAP